MQALSLPLFFSPLSRILQGHWIKVDVPIDDYVDYSSSPVPSQWNEILLVGSKYARNIELLIDDIGVFDSEQNHNNMPKLPEFIESSTAKTGSEAEGEEQGHGWCEYLDTAAGGLGVENCIER